jgi:hypothetical protein
MIKRKIKINVDSDILRNFPKLSQFEKTIDILEVQKYLKMFNSMAELTAVMTSEGMRVSSRDHLREESHSRFDDLGIRLPDNKQSMICDVMREESGHDPRRHIVVCKRSLPYSKDLISEGLGSQRHAFDTITDEELVQRRIKLS